jgi:hypothetical protein
MKAHFVQGWRRFARYVVFGTAVALSSPLAATLIPVDTSAQPEPDNGRSTAQTGPAITQLASDPVLVGAADIADCGTTTDSATAALLNGIDGTVFTAGDNAYPVGGIQDFINCYETTWGPHKARTRPAPGNHDYLSLFAFPYYAYFGAHAGPPFRGYYSYDLGAWHIVSLDSNIAAFAGSPQEMWLRADLAANPTQCTLAYWHHPLFSSGQHGNQFLVRDLYQALYDAGADVVITGHDHDYEHFHRQNPAGVLDANGIRQFVIGTGGTGLRPFLAAMPPTSAVRNSDTHGVLKLTLHPTSYDWQFIPIAGKTFTDSGSRPCVGSAPAALGGRGFAAGGSAAGVQMVWTTGTAQTGYLVARYVGSTPTILSGPSGPLPATATQYVDTSAPAGVFACYVLYPLSGGAVAGQSDALCHSRAASATGAPGSTMVQLNQGTMATVTWSAPGGQTGYLLWRIPLNGTPQSGTWLPAVATRAMDETGGNPTCYAVLAMAGSTAIGNSDIVCAIPGQSALTSAAPLVAASTPD